MATFNYQIQISNGTTVDTFHPETNSTQVYDFNNAKWLSSIIGVLNTLSTTQKTSLVAAINEITVKQTEHLSDTTKKHIEIVDVVPSDLKGTGLFFEKQGGISAAPIKPTIQDINDKLDELWGKVMSNEFSIETRASDPVSPEIGKVWFRKDVDASISTPLRIMTNDGIKGISLEELEYIRPTLALKTYVYIKDNFLVSRHDGALHLSVDSGRTFTKSLTIGAEVGLIKYVHVFSDGALLFCSNTNAYYSSDFLTYSKSTILDTDGSPIALTAIDSFNPFVHDRKTQIVNGVEMLVFGNYTNFGDSPIRVWYTADKGRTLKVAYQFNASGSNAAMHVHNVIFNPSDNAFWILTGDYVPDEIVPTAHFMKCFYDTINDSWTFETVGSGLRHKAGQMVFYGEYAYWNWDNTNGGVIRCKYDEIGDVTKYEQLMVTPNDTLDIVMNEKGEMIVIQSFYGGSDDPRYIWYSPDRVNFHKILTNPDVAWSARTCYFGLRGPNRDGRVLAGIANNDISNTANWELMPSIFLDDFVRAAGFPNAFKPS